MKILPISLKENKDKYNNFFIHLINLKLKTGISYFSLCDTDIPFNGKNYIALPGELGSTKQTVDNKTDNLEVTLSDCTDAFKLALFQGLDPRGCRLEVIRVHYPECLTVNEYDYVFVGDLDSLYLDDGKGTFKATVRNSLGNFETGRTCMFGCNAEFGDPDECGVNKGLTNIIVQAGSDQNNAYINLSQPNDFYKDGILTVNYESRKIITNIGNKIDVEFPFSFIVETGDTGSIEKGCSYDPTGCKRHNNMQNYGGFPGIPWENVIKT